MRHLDLFSGIGGFAFAAEMVWDDVGHIFCDINPFAQAILRKHWPEAKIYDDIKTLTGGGLGAIDLVTGGFPCQPFSNAGKRKGTADDRHLWPEMLRVIREVHPRWIIGENVDGLTTWNGGMVFELVLSDLENAGYEAQPFVIPASAVGAHHRRDRVWIVAHAHSGGHVHGKSQKFAAKGRQYALGQFEPSRAYVADPECQRRNGRSEQKLETNTKERGASSTQFTRRSSDVSDSKSGRRKGGGSTNTTKAIMRSRVRHSPESQRCIRPQPFRW